MNSAEAIALKKFENENLKIVRKFGINEQFIQKNQRIRFIWKGNRMWIKIPKLLSRQFYDASSLRKYVARFRLLHRGSCANSVSKRENYYQGLLCRLVYIHIFLLLRYQVWAKHFSLLSRNCKAQNSLKSEALYRFPRKLMR